jgi:EAL domain-containing protein (putative c-di-GMP-specific phosphodiesterase class I)
MSLPSIAQRLDEFPDPGTIDTRFQPISRQAGGRREIIAFECLARGTAGSPLESAAELFARVRHLGIEAAIDRTCVTRALKAAHALQAPLFLNIHAVTLAAPRGFVDFILGALAEADRRPSQVVLEIIEHDREIDCDRVRDTINALWGQGIAVALDDFGANRADQQLFRAWRPQWLKLDASLLRWARRSPAARQLIDCAVREARRTDARVIAEGLESDRDLELAERMGIDLVQGYVISRPVCATDAAALAATHAATHATADAPGH